MEFVEFRFHIVTGNFIFAFLLCVNCVRQTELIVQVHILHYLAHKVLVVVNISNLFLVSLVAKNIRISCVKFQSRKNFVSLQEIRPKFFHKESIYKSHIL